MLLGTRLRTPALLVPLVLVAGCGTEVKQVAATPSPTAAPVIPWPTPPDVEVATAAPTAPAAGPLRVRRSAGRHGRHPTASPSPAPSLSSSPEPLGRDPLLLVGWWRVATATTQLDLGLGEDAVVLHPCGASMIDWAASPTGLFVAAGLGGDSSCYEHSPHPDLSWLERGWAFAVSHQRLLLVDDAGVVVARGVREKPPAGRSAFAVTPERRGRLADARQLPVAVRPVTVTSLARRWVPHGHDAGNGKAFVTFTTTRTWDGSDGCNGAGGRFSLGDFGEVVTTSGPSTVIGCDSSPAPSWLARVRRLGLDKDGSLALYDAQAQLLGRLYPS